MIWISCPIVVGVFSRHCETSRRLLTALVWLCGEVGRGYLWWSRGGGGWACRPGTGWSSPWRRPRARGWWGWSACGTSASWARWWRWATPPRGYPAAWPSARGGSAGPSTHRRNVNKNKEEIKIKSSSHFRPWNDVRSPSGLDLNKNGKWKTKEKWKSKGQKSGTVFHVNLIFTLVNVQRRCPKKQKNNKISWLCLAPFLDLCF